MDLQEAKICFFKEDGCIKPLKPCECQAGDVEMESKGACDDFCCEGKVVMKKILGSKIIEMDLETSSIYCGLVTSQLKK